MCMCVCVYVCMCMSVCLHEPGANIAAVLVDPAAPVQQSRFLATAALVAAICPSLS